MTRTKSTYLASLVILLSPLAANAVPIVAPVSASADVAGLDTASPANTINQSGLASGYVAGVTDFDTYTASVATTGSGGFTAIYLPLPVDFLATLTYGFGASVGIQSIGVWNNTGTSTSGIDAISGFNLFADNDGIFGNGTTSLLGSFSMAPRSFGTTPADVFSFGAVTTPYVHLVITGTQAGRRPGINEVVFEAASVTVPEPSTLALLGIGLFGMGLARRRKTV